jgi:AraC-like DNA-binding protein
VTTTTTLEANRRRMVQLLAELATSEGLRPSILDDVKLGRADRRYERAPVLYEGTGAAIAASSVGYESPSQFSREFKRFFGASPSEEARRVRAFIAEPTALAARATS